MFIRYIFFLFLISCQFEKSLEKEIKVFDAQLFLKLTPTYRAKIINEEFINSENPVSRPFFTAQPILEFDSLGNDGKSTKTFCLIYRIPTSKGFGGWIRLIENSCGKKEPEYITNISSINKLFILLSSNPVIRGDEKTKPFTLTLKFEKDKKNYKIEIPLLNLSKEEIFLKDSKKLRPTSVSTLRFSNGILPTFVPGVIFFPLGNENQGGKKIQMIGEILDNYASGTSKICHRVNENCESVGDYLCDQCKFGWFETVPTKCSLTGDKFCGIDRCGEKGFPACFRGYKYGLNQTVWGCNPENKAAFCQKDLNLICDPQGILICD
ncbi:MAG: hypothetical protein ACHQYQ_00745 [Bacteriovoracales bacterium]